MKIPILKLYYLFGLINSVYILKQIVDGQTYYDARIDTKKINGTESWPAKMRLRVINYGYFCEIPFVNLSSSAIETDEECLINAWNLPPNSKLSPIMRDIGRCHLAADEMAKNGIYFDADKCNCVGWWPVILFALVLFAYLFNACRCICDFLIGEIEESMFCVFQILQFILHFGWFASATLLNFYLIDKIDIGVSFTVNGDGYSKNYYSKATEWKSISIQAYISYIVIVAESVIYKVVEWKSRPSQFSFILIIIYISELASALFNLLLKLYLS